MPSQTTPPTHSPSTLHWRTPEALNRRSLVLHQAAAAWLTEHPELFARVQATMVRLVQHADPRSGPYTRRWQQAVQQGMAACIALAVDPSEEGDALRQCSPLAGVLPQRERWAILRATAPRREA